MLGHNLGVSSDCGESREDIVGYVIYCVIFCIIDHLLNCCDFYSFVLSTLAGMGFDTVSIGAERVSVICAFFLGCSIQEVIYFPHLVGSQCLRIWEVKWAYFGDSI